MKIKEDSSHLGAVVGLEATNLLQQGKFQFFKEWTLTPVVHKVLLKAGVEYLLQHWPEDSEITKSQLEVVHFCSVFVQVINTRYFSRTLDISFIFCSQKPSMAKMPKMRILCSEHAAGCKDVLAMLSSK